jgi:hypothetical protein
VKLRVLRKWKFGIFHNFVITDESGAVRYTAKGNVIKLQVFDATGKLVGVLDSGKVFARAVEVREYAIIVGNEKLGMYNRKQKTLTYEYELVGLPWTVDVDTDEVKQDDVVIAKMKDIGSFFLYLIPLSPRKYVVEIHNPENELTLLLIALGWQYYEER